MTCYGSYIIREVPPACYKDMYVCMYLCMWHAIIKLHRNLKQVYIDELANIYVVVLYMNKHKYSRFQPFLLEHVERYYTRPVRYYL